MQQIATQRDTEFWRRRGVVYRKWAWYQNSLRALYSIFSSTPIIVKLAIKINWLRIWEAARDRGPYWSRAAQPLTFPLFGDRVCRKCLQAIPIELTYIEHLIDSHCPSNLNLDSLISELNCLWSLQ